MKVRLRPYTPPHETVVDVAMRCFVGDVSISHALDGAGIAASTWTRWRREGAKPQAAVLEKLNRVIDQLIERRIEEGRKAENDGKARPRKAARAKEKTNG